MVALLLLVFLPYVLSIASPQCSCSEYLPCAEINSVQKTFPECVDHCREKHPVPLPKGYIDCLEEWSDQLTKTISCMFKENGPGCTSSKPRPAQERKTEKFKDAVKDKFKTFLEALGHTWDYTSEAAMEINRCMLRCFYPGRNVCSISMGCTLLMRNETEMADTLFKCGRKSGIGISEVKNMALCLALITEGNGEMEERQVVAPEKSEETEELEENDPEGAGSQELSTTTEAVAEEAIQAHGRDQGESKKTSKGGRKLKGHKKIKKLGRGGHRIHDHGGTEAEEQEQVQEKIPRRPQHYHGDGEHSSVEELGGGRGSKYSSERRGFHGRREHFTRARGRHLESDEGEEEKAKVKSSPHRAASIRHPKVQKSEEKSYEESGFEEEEQERYHGRDQYRRPQDSHKGEGLNENQTPSTLSTYPTLNSQVTTQDTTTAAEGYRTPPQAPLVGPPAPQAPVYALPASPSAVTTPYPYSTSPVVERRCTTLTTLFGLVQTTTTAPSTAPPVPLPATIERAQPWSPTPPPNPPTWPAAAPSTSAPSLPSISPPGYPTFLSIPPPTTASSGYVTPPKK